MKQRQKIPQINKVRAELQRDVNSECPFCGDTEVGHFEIHHIDEDPSHNDPSNLLLICPTCHSKITKKDISRQDVEEKKWSLGSRKPMIELASIVLDEASCAWESSRKVPYAFYAVDNDKSPFPVLGFSFINHSDRTILFTGLHLRVKIHPSGLSGLPEPRILEPTIRYQIPIPIDKEEEKFNLAPIQMPSEQACKIEVELIDKYEDEVYAPEGRMVLYFTLYFNDSIAVPVPPIFLNCKSEYVGPRKLVIIS